jgi:hemoglobin
MNPTAPPSPYAIIGPAAIAACVNRFYDIIDAEPHFAPLRRMHGTDLGSVRHGLERYLTGWLGGPRDWFDRGECIMSIHRVFAIDTALADLWAKAMAQAITREPSIDKGLGAKMSDALAHMAHAMVNISHDN